MWIDRKYAKLIQRLTDQFSAVLITGPRQVGKTSLLQKLYPDYQYISFDHPIMAEKATKNPDEFLETLKEPVILDEIQYTPSLFRYLKNKIDKNKKIGQFLLTGSQSFPLMQNVSESLAGRCGILEMHSLSYEEVKNKIPEYSDKDYIIKGGFPELYKSNVDSFYWYSAYMATYLERDIRNMRQVGSLGNFERLLRAIAARTGQILSYSELARDVGVVTNTVKDWISILQASGQIFILEPYYKNVGKRLVKSPKIYISDIGLASYLTGIQSWDDLIKSPLAGAFWETYVVGEMMRYFHSRGQRPPLWFWRTSYGDEIDLLIEKGGRFITIECKLAEVPSKKHLKVLSLFRDLYGENSIEKSYLVCRSPESYYDSNDRLQIVSGKDITEMEI